MLNLVTGIILLIATLYVWALPNEEQTTSKLMSTLIPLAIVCLGVAATVLIARSVYAGGLI